LPSKFYDNNYNKTSKEIIVMIYELIESLRRHEKWAQEQLYSKYNDRFIGYVLKRRRQLVRMDAQEISHNAFLHIFKYIGGFSGVKSFDSWVYSILHNAMNQYINRQYEAVSKITCRPLENFSQDAFYYSPELEWIDYEKQQQAIKDILDTKMRTDSAARKRAYEIICMYHRGYNCRDIAEYFNISYGRVKQIKQEATKHIITIIN